ncbi:MAG TPA: iron ABC transporter permease [Spirochaetota bacterium]|jgi:iron complex transport system permease protein|nr:iron ABC transporter permease [Spirochaetota bacterium]HOH37180.1 iron ABC transporter permease [Spirochaetota bacterium]HPJ13723.1 iron ABC transporter permease [Spirochaetota bacterium]HPW50957.1 iron ABC transporter permease [Spirochaetota bacterium]HPY04066.1 iron ABC transporter permease [Spirochaetota bacterium]
MKLFVWICVLILLSSTALLVGKYPVNFISLISGNGASPEDINTFKMIIINSRLPRILSALLIGGCLSAAGAVYQGIFRNPMVSPDMLGASSGSAFGAALAILFRFSIKGVEALSFASGIAAVAITWTISSTVSKARSSLVLILSGILVSTVFTSLLSLVKFTADPYSKLPDITFWLLGNLSAVSLSDTVFVSGCALLGFIPLFLIRWKINVLSLSEDEARALGMNTRAYRLIIIACATLMTSAAVSVCGLIGWVGLVVPHIVRMIFGPDYKTLVTASIVIGGIYLLTVDTLARYVLSIEIPLGILTAIIGAPFFIYLMTKSERGWS